MNREFHDSLPDTTRSGIAAVERKRRLLAIMPAVECRLLYLDQLAGRGRDLFRLACERDLEDIVAEDQELGR